MPLTVTRVEHALLDAPAMVGPLSEEQNRGARNAIRKVNAANMFGAIGTFVPDQDGWRVDRQSPPPGYINISVQRNGCPPPSTVATVFVPGVLNIAPPPGGVRDSVFHARIRELERVTRHGLLMSLDSHQAVRDHGWIIVRYKVDGQFSA